MRKVAVGFLLAPLFATLPPAAFAAVQWWEVDAVLAIGVGTLVSGYLATALFGVPLFLLLRRTQRVTLGSSITLGLATAFLYTLLLIYALATAPGAPPWLIGLRNLGVFTLPAGAAGGLAFWWFGIRARHGSNNSAQ